VLVQPLLGLVVFVRGRRIATAVFNHELAVHDRRVGPREDGQPVGKRLVQDRLDRAGVDHLDVLQRVGHPAGVALEVLEAQEAELDVLPRDGVAARELDVVPERKRVFQTVRGDLERSREVRHKRGEVLHALRHHQGIIGVQVDERRRELELPSGVERLHIGLVVGHDQRLIAARRR